MTAKPLVPRERANRDVREAVAWYLDKGGPEVALGFIDAVEQAFRLVSRSPAAGSPRYGQELGIPGLRSWPLTNYSRLVFYRERPDYVDVWRVLAAQRDVPAWLQETDPG